MPEWYISLIQWPQGICLIHVTDITYNNCIYCMYVLIYIFNPNSQAVKKECGPQKGYGEKRCEIQGGGQEMAVMVGLW